MVLVLWILSFLHLLHIKNPKRCKRQISSIENMRINHNIGHSFVVRSLACDAANMPYSSNISMVSLKS
jgi:hypothetical protein